MTLKRSEKGRGAAIDPYLRVNGRNFLEKSRQFYPFPNKYEGDPKQNQADIHRKISEHQKESRAREFALMNNIGPCTIGERTYPKSFIIQEGKVFTREDEASYGHKEHSDEIHTGGTSCADMARSNEGETKEESQGTETGSQKE